MSEEEIIRIIKEKIILDFNCYNPIDKIELEAIQSLLDLYNKEKEKNKELLYKLEVEKIDNKYNKEEAQEEMIPKYKIRAKIEELEGQEDWYIENKCLDDLYGRINELKELLEE